MSKQRFQIYNGTSIENLIFQVNGCDVRGLYSQGKIMDRNTALEENNKGFIIKCYILNQRMNV